MGAPFDELYVEQGRWMMEDASGLVSGCAPSLGPADPRAQKNYSSVLKGADGHQSRWEFSLCGGSLYSMLFPANKQISKIV